MIRELISALEASLVRTASEPGLSEEMKMTESLRQTKDAADALVVVWKARAYLSEQENEDYVFARDKILIYLLYYDRVLRFLAGDATPGDWYQTNMFAPADYYDWRKAQLEARKLFVKYIKKDLKHGDQ